MGLLSLPPELFIQICSYIPLPSAYSLLLVNKHLFHLLYGHITHSSFAPWRKHYFRYQRIYTRVCREADKYIAQKQDMMRNRDQATAALNGQEQIGFSIELELEAISREMAGHLGLLPKHKEISASSSSSNSSIDPGAISLPQITINSLFTALQHVSNLETGFQRLQPLECPLSSIIEILHRKYPHIEFVQKLCPVALIPKSSTFTMPLETAATYRVFTAYLLFTSLTPHDILEILSDALLASEKSTYSMDSIRCSQEAALVEYFHFLLLFLSMYNFDYRIRHLETLPLLDKNISFHAQRILSWRLTTWIQGYFRPERPLFPPPLKMESDGRPQTELPIGILSGRESMNTTPSSPFLEMGSVPSGASSWPTLRSPQTYPAVAQQQQQNPAYFLTQEQQKVVDTDVSVGELMHVIAYGGTGKTICLAEYAKKRYGLYAHIAQFSN
ncbi:hypothetical protein P167DRAFT_106314 [Morchella conica CCBAS932]|uniref:F-box domain-containing protein n=1 Tax=Morchella conica CCBAS932 TaxID=1392247 RepID=A0A3N4KT05_9PEZI|nr:hypothetical protein P167DRAFT_106314 [Morchella conica CCBAS932]